MSSMIDLVLKAQGAKKSHVTLTPQQFKIAEFIKGKTKFFYTLIVKDFYKKISGQGIKKNVGKKSAREIFQEVSRQQHHRSSQ